MDFYINNQDGQSPILAIKSSSLVSLELVFVRNESEKRISAFSEWFDGSGPFRAVWLRGDELKITTMSPHHDNSFKALFSHPISEREIEVLLKALITHHCLESKYKQDLQQALIRNFAKMRLASLQAQVKKLLEQLVQVHKVGVIYLDRVHATEGFLITADSKKNILDSLQHLKKIMDVITKMISEKKVAITKEEMMLLLSFKASCHIKSEHALVNGWCVDEALADELTLFVRDFSSFVANYPKENLSNGIAQFGLYKPPSEHKLTTPEVKSLSSTCAIL